MFSKEEINALARNSSFVKREKKLDGISFLTSLIFTTMRHKCPSLADLKQDLAIEHGIEISCPGLQKKFNKNTYEFLRQVYDNIAQLSVSTISKVRLEKHFSSLMIRDSSKCRLPNYFYKDYPSQRPHTPNEPGMLNIQFEVDLINKSWADLQLTSSRRNDQTDSAESLSNLKAKSLNIRDLGYVGISYMEAVIKADAFFVNRLPAKTHIFDQNGKQIDWEWLHKRVAKSKSNCLEMNILLGANTKMPVRLVVSTVSEELAEQRIKDAITRGKRAKNYQLTEEFIARAKLSLIVTNVPNSIIPKGQIWETYMLRWQIELLFKAFKSEANIDKCHPMKTIRMECHLMAKFIWAAINNYIRLMGESFLADEFGSQHSSSFSILKLLKRAKNDLHFLRKFLNGFIDSHTWIVNCLIPLLQNSTLEDHTKRINSRQLLTEIGK